MDNFSRLENEHREFFKLPKLPYVIGASKAKILTLNESIPNYPSTPDEEWFCAKEIVDLYDRALIMYDFVKGRCSFANVDFDETINFINALQTDEYDQLVIDMEKYLKLEKESQSTISSRNN